MNIVYDKKYLIIVLTLCLCISVFQCADRREKKYYYDKRNYITVTGVVDHYQYSNDGTSLCLGFSDLSYDFDDDSFEIVGDNLTIAKDNGIDDKIKIGDKVSFTTAPEYFGDGYIMPIVAISVDGEELLDFEQGYENLLKWLK